MTIEKSQNPNTLTGADRQEWQRLQNPPFQPKPEVTRSSGPLGGGSSTQTGGLGSDSGDRFPGNGGSSGPGLAEGVFAMFGGAGEKMAEMANWVVQRFPPLRAGIEFGEDLVEAGWRTRLFFSIPTALAGAGAASGHALWPWAGELLASIAGSSAPIVALGLGAVLGWLLPTVLGLVLAFGLFLVGLAIGLALVGGVLGLLYLGIAAIAHWPPFSG